LSALLRPPVALAHRNDPMRPGHPQRPERLPDTKRLFFTASAWRSAAAPFLWHTPARRL